MNHFFEKRNGILINYKKNQRNLSNNYIFRPWKKLVNILYILSIESRATFN